MAEALDIEVYELIKPHQPAADEITGFIQTYTEKALKTVSEAVVRSLDGLRKQYIE